MKLIVGLGNPGKEYSGSRHNIGFRCINHLAKKYAIGLSHTHGRARTGYGRIEGQDVILAKPQTYMNRSGQSVALLARKHSIAPADIVVIHDDLDLPLGRIRLRPRGSSGGHKGIASIIEALGGQEFARLRLGIGRPAEQRREVIDYVLGDFLPDEGATIDQAVARAADAVACFVREGLAAAMNAYNAQNGLERAETPGVTPEPPSRRGRESCGAQGDKGDARNDS